MSDTTTATNLDRPARRSTRIDQAVPITVMGIDSWRGPYREQVATITVSAHGCKYESKYQVMNDSLVILELNGTKKDDPPISARGRVKWVKRPANTGELFQTAVELEDPGNFWGIKSPPQDWLPYCAPKPVAGDTTKPRLVAVPKPGSGAGTLAGGGLNAQPGVAVPQSAGELKLALTAPAKNAASSSRPMGQLMGEFQQQMEKMLSEAASAAVRERSTDLLADVRAGLRDEARKILAEAATTQAGPWVEKSLKQLAQANQETARALHAQWTRKVEADLKKAAERLDEHSRELVEHAGSVATSAAERLQRVMEASRREEVDRFVARLKEQLSPLLDHAQKIAGDLGKRTDHAEKILASSFENTVAHLEEAYERAHKQFEHGIHERIAAATKEIERAGREAISGTLAGFRGSYEEFEVQARKRLEAALAPVVEKALAGVKEKTAEASRQFAGEIAHYSRGHLEYVGNAIAELAKGLGKFSKE